MHALQGEVESIAQMKPKGANDHEEGLLEYLEDIIGTARYKPLIEEAAVDVERLGDDRQVQMNRVKLVEKEKSSLEVRSPLSLDLSASPLESRLTQRLFPRAQTRKKAADTYLKDQVVLVSLQNRLYQRHAHQAGADKAVYEEQAADAKRELDAEMERQKVDRSRYDADVAALDETKNNLKEIEDAAGALSKELASYEKIKVQLGVQKKAADVKVSKLKKSLEEVRPARAASSILSFAVLTLTSSCRTSTRRSRRRPTSATTATRTTSSSPARMASSQNSRSSRRRSPRSWTACAVRPLSLFLASSLPLYPG